MAKKPPGGRIGRLARLGKLTSKVGTSYVAQRVSGVFQDADGRRDAIRKLHVANAERVADTMGNLKGAAMKLGQTVALFTEGMDLPPEVSANLRKLNDKAEPIPFEVIREDVEAELERPLEEAFSRFDPEPLGCASLGQAHAARLPDHTPVVVKVLHRGIDTSVDSDLSAVKSMLFTGRVLRRDRAEVEAIFAEIRERLHEELDYYQEAANIEFFRREMAAVENIRVPRTHPGWCTGRVLTMDHLPGVPLDNFMKFATRAARQRAGVALAESFHHMLYNLRALHADPHAGNYLFEPDGTVGLLDFGCVRRYDEFWVARYARSGRTAVALDRRATLALCEELGAILPKRRPEAEDILWEFCRIITDPFRVHPFEAGGPMDQVQEKVNRIIPRILRYPEIRAPRELFYLNRALNGMYSMQRRLNVVCDYGAMFDRYSRPAIIRAEGSL